MEANASKHASKCEHACARARVCVCERACRRARARSLMATLPGGGPAEDGSELRSHACGVAKVEARGHVRPRRQPHHDRHGQGHPPRASGEVRPRV